MTPVTLMTSKDRNMVIHAGLLHYVENLSCEPAMAVVSFDSRSPGRVSVGFDFFQLPVETIQGTIPGLDADTIHMIKDLVDAPEAVNPSVNLECAKRCNLEGY
jgi:hypothetical protein